MDDFLTSDGEKPTRRRDAEFGSNPERTRDELMEIWERGWSSLGESLGALVAADLDKTVVIRGEEHTVPEAIQRQIVHASYHIGQIVYLARHVSAHTMAEPDHPQRPIRRRERTLQEALTS